MRKMALVLSAFGLLSLSVVAASAHETGKPHKHSKKKAAEDKKDDAAKTDEAKPAEKQAK